MYVNICNESFRKKLATCQLFTTYEKRCEMKLIRAEICELIKSLSYMKSKWVYDKVTFWYAGSVIGI